MNAQRASPWSRQEWFARLTRWAFLLALIVAGARAMMTENLREPFDPAPGMWSAPRGPGPAVSLLLDLLACVPALLVLLRRLIDRTYVVRLAASHALLAALAFWICLSVSWSADRFAAAVHAANFVSALSLLWAMTQLVRSWGRLRVVAGLAFGLLLVYLAAGLNDRLVTHPQVVRDWCNRDSDTSRWQFMERRGLRETDYEFRRFEANILSGELRSFGNSSNTYAAVMVLLAVVAAGAAIQRLVHGDSPAWALPILAAILLLPYILYHTHSVSAFVTPLLAAGMLAGTALLRRQLAAQPRRFYWAALGAFLLGTAALLAHGLYHNSLAVRTLTFRWYYWTGAARILADHPLRGVGWANFGEYYPAVRLPLATEEVRDPHNFIVKAFAELGIVGGILMLAWMLRIWWELTSPNVPPDRPGPSVSGQQRGIIFLATPALLASTLSILLKVDFSQEKAWVLMQCLEGAIGLVLLLIGLSAVSFESLLQEKIDPRPSPWLLYAILAGLGVFLVHNLIDFSLFEPGAQCLFALLAGSALGVRFPPLAGRRRRNWLASGAFAGALLSWLGLAGTLWAPTLAAETIAAQADAAMRSRRFADAAILYHRACRNQPANADYAFRTAQALAARGEHPTLVEGMIEMAIQTNPRAVRYYLWRAEYELSKSRPEAQVVANSLQRAIQLNPRDAEIRLIAADSFLKLDRLQEALEQYRAAIACDEQLPPQEPKRLSPERRREIEEKIRQLSAGKQDAGVVNNRTVSPGRTVVSLLRPTDTSATRSIRSPFLGRSGSSIVG